MKINDSIVRAYLNGEEQPGLAQEWYFTASSVAGAAGRNIFTEPAREAAVKEKVRAAWQAIMAQAQGFLPTNRPVWDALFPDWPGVLEDTDIDLIVGFPEPYDAEVEYDPAGRRHVVFDLICWSRYVGHCELGGLVQNLLTHELCHVLTHRSHPGLAAALTSPDYRTSLDAVCFDEAFAHLVSYEARELAETNWQSETLAGAARRSRARMRQALAEEDPQRRQQNLYEAVCGNYYDKFACISGMLWLANRWLSGGIPALVQEFSAGFGGFAQKAAREAAQEMAQKMVK